MTHVQTRSCETHTYTQLYLCFSAKSEDPVTQLWQRAVVKHNWPMLLLLWCFSCLLLDLFHLFGSDSAAAALVQFSVDVCDDDAFTNDVKTFIQRWHYLREGPLHFYRLDCRIRQLFYKRNMTALGSVLRAHEVHRLSLWLHLVYGQTAPPSTLLTEEVKGYFVDRDNVLSLWVKLLIGLTVRERGVWRWVTIKAGGPLFSETSLAYFLPTHISLPNCSWAFSFRLPEQVSVWVWTAQTENRRATEERRRWSLMCRCRCALL